MMGRVLSQWSEPLDILEQIDDPLDPYINMKITTREPRTGRIVDMCWDPVNRERLYRFLESGSSFSELFNKAELDELCEDQECLAPYSSSESGGEDLDLHG